MGNLQNGVAALLEKCAKYKAGQAVYYVTLDADGESEYATAVIIDRFVGFDKYYGKHNITYKLKAPNGNEWYEDELHVAASLEELKTTMRNKHLRIAEQWKNPVDADKEEAEDGMDD